MSMNDEQLDAARASAVAEKVFKGNFIAD